MKKYAVVVIMGFLAAGAAQAQSAGAAMYVAVKNTALKSSTGFFAETKSALALGDAVTVVQVKGQWLEVRSSSGLQGWVPAASLTSKKILSSSGRSASASELALAGKGFSGDVEKAYGSDAGVDFSGVDDMESLVVSERELLDFIDEGHLSKGE